MTCFRPSRYLRLKMKASTLQNRAGARAMNAISLGVTAGFMTSISRAPASIPAWLRVPLT